ncbi:MAG: hypothetical protein KME28_14480 [Pelatocladus maniniholoensis HA4357-MV3]|jgi:hypothetical protein|uniref:Uncharacterized protein n=1 Tax=Pelatocladus maniniholoensis HA4357-MV3 TaxID=1117104 RepID=A0A9E3H8V4_9NOST|nr:hypothetical protein [Pelatocladus maniniholoensis HA4357-MV3]
MSLIDGLLLTLISTVICIVFPKLLSIILATKTKHTSSTPAQVKMQETETTTEVANLPS